MWTRDIGAFFWSPHVGQYKSMQMQMITSLVPRPHPEEGKGSGDVSPDPTSHEEKGSGELTISLVWPALRARTDTAVLKQISDHGRKPAI